MMRPVLACLLLTAGTALSAHARPPEPSPQPVVHLEQERIEGAGTRILSKAAGDTVRLYGGPGSSEGRFETVTGVADWQGWTSVDRTDFRHVSEWQVSTYNAETLGGHGAGNQAMWCGQSAAQQPGWAAAPGYGNGWRVGLEWSSGPLADPSQGQTVSLDFFFHHDSEPGYDYLFVQYDSAGTWQDCLEIDGSNREIDGSFGAPGMAYADVKQGEIVYAGNDYAGENGDEIHLRLYFFSDGAFSDEDGLWPTDGAVQVDDILVQWQDAGPRSSFEDFEGAGPYPWTQTPKIFVGDFAKLYVGLRDVDPCSENPSVQVCFLDDGTPPNNAPGETTGGTTSATYGYAVSGGYVVNHTGGLSGDLLDLWNEVWSPPIAWDLAGTADDGLDGGALLNFDLWGDINFLLGNFFVWHVRASEDGGASWGDWEDRNFIYESPAIYRRARFQIRDLLPAAPTHVQIALGVRDYTHVFHIGGEDASPGPFFDNVELLRYRSGPRLGTFAASLFQSSFPQSGLIDPSPDPAALACRLDCGRDLNQNLDPSSIIPGDSLVVEARPLVPGRSLARLELKWLLDLNPLFASVRSTPPGTSVQPGAGVNGWDRWTGTLLPQDVTTVYGTVIPYHWFFDFDYEGGAAFPHQSESELAFFFPGDRLRYYIEAEDDLGLETTLPSDISGFESGVNYDDRFEVHALPSLRGSLQDGTYHTSMLLVDAADRPAFPERVESYTTEGVSGTPLLDGTYDSIFREFGLVEGLDFDRFTLLAAHDSNRSNGLGSAQAWGANAAQLDGYDVILIAGGQSPNGTTLGDGSTYALKSDDVGVLTAWWQSPGDRGLAVFGDHVMSSGYAQGGPGFATFLNDILGVDIIDDDVAPGIDDQNSPTVLPLLPGFDQEYTAVAGCRLPLGDQPLNTFDWLMPTNGAAMSHGYEVASAPGTPYTTAAASVAREEVVGSDLKRAISFPYDLQSVWDERSETGDDHSRLFLMYETLSYLSPGSVWPANILTGQETPSRAGIHDLRAVPNPFNPATTLRFSVGRTAEYTATVFDLRGRRVRTLHRGELLAGPQALPWDGRDEGGRAVASGVYVMRVEGDGEVQKRKVALLK